MSPAPTASSRRSAWSIRERRARSSSTCRATCRRSIPARSRPRSRRCRSAGRHRDARRRNRQRRRAQQSQRGQGGRLAGLGSPVTPSRLRALYFTRATAPAGEGPLYHHIGLYAYRRAALERFVKLPPSPLERRERLEQLRALEAGMRIDVAIVDTVPLGVDTPEDLEPRAPMLDRRPLTRDPAGGSETEAPWRPTRRSYSRASRGRIRTSRSMRPIPTTRPSRARPSRTPSPP